MDVVDLAISYCPVIAGISDKELLFLYGNCPPLVNNRKKNLYSLYVNYISCVCTASVSLSKSTDSMSDTCSCFMLRFRASVSVCVLLGG